MRINLATTADFALERRREVLAPRMMQVFVALAQAGGIASRNRLTDLC